MSPTLIGAWAAAGPAPSVKTRAAAERDRRRDARMRKPPRGWCCARVKRQARRVSSRFAGRARAGGNPARPPAVTSDQGGGLTMTNPLSRREVLKYGAFTTVGGVLTPGISLAQAITTESRGLTARDIQLQSGGTAIPAYDARPEAAGRYPILVVISGFTGNSEQHKDVVRRFAQAGYYAIAPELFSREGGMQGKNFQEMGQIAAKVTRAQYLGDIRAGADYAKQQSWARADRLGVTGFCGGGALTLHTAAEYPGVGAAVPWYGQVNGPSPLKPAGALKACS